MKSRPLAYQAYEQLAESYAARVETKPHNAYYERPAMLSLMPNVEGARVLDAGCGPGVYSEALIYRGAASVESIDMSETMLRLAAERLKESIATGRVRLHQLDMSMPLVQFDDQEFDYVNAPLCCDYIQDWRSLFREFFRLLKPGGTFLFSGGHPAFDAEYFRTNKYFSVEQVECEWRGFDVNVVMPSYRRSLSETLNPVIEAGFVLDRIHEPLPNDEFQKTDSRRYKMLTHRPCFLCVRAKKPM